MNDASHAPRALEARTIIVGLAGLVVGLFLSTQIPAQRLFGSPVPETLLREAGFIERTANFAAVLDRASPDSLEHIREQIDSFDPGQQPTNLLLFADWWTRFDAEAANGWAIRYEREHDLKVRHGVFRAWARQDPQRALSFAKASFRLGGSSLDGDASNNPYLTAVVLGWDESGLPGLNEWVIESEKIERQVYMQNWARQRVAVMTPDAAWAWAEDFPDPLQNEMIPAVAAALAARSPENALRLAMPRIESGDRLGLSQRIATRWVRRDPEAAMEWLSGMRTEFARNHAVLEASRNWSYADPDAFASYMERQLDDHPRWLEPAIELYSRTLAAEGSPKRGLEVARGLSDQARVDYNTTKILSYWLSKDRPAAAAWIEANDVSEVILKRAGYRRPRS